MMLAIAPPIRAVALVPRAKLQIDMRFGLLAKTMVVTQALQTVLTVALAALNYGAYSVILPVPLIEVIRAAVYWWVVRSPIRLNIQLRRWRYLVSDAFYTFIAEICFRVVLQGDYVTLALLYGVGEMGLYYFAFNLSLQTISLFTTNLAKVLFPALSQLQTDSQRQVRAFIKSARLLALVAIPGCFLQATVADDFVRALYKPEWYGAIPLIQIFSIAFAFRAVGGSDQSLMMAQGRFKTLMLWAFSTMILFLLCILTGAWFSVVGAAIGLLVFSIVVGPCGAYVAIRTGGGRWRDVWDIYARPMLSAAAAAAIGWLASRMIPAVPGLAWWRIAVIVLIGSGSYTGIVWQIARPQLQEIWLLGIKLLARRGKKSAEVDPVENEILEELVRVAETPDELIDR